MISHRPLEDSWSPASRERWDDLARGCPGLTPFQSSSWLSLWWQTFGRHRRPHIWGVFDGSDLVAAWPGYRSQMPWRALRTMGTGQSDYLMPLIRPGYESAFQSSWQEHIESLADVDLLDLHQLREGCEGFARTGHRVAQAKCFVLELQNSFETYTKSLSKSLRYEVQRLNKPPYSNQEARILTATIPDEARRYLQVFLDLHAQRWRKRGLPGAFASRRIQAFHLAFVAQAVERDELRLSVLEYQGQFIGAIYAMRAGSGTFFYQSGFDPGAKTLSPGTVLVASAIKRAFEDGCQVFDFLRGDEPYKQRWKPQHTYENGRFMQDQGGLRGRAGNRMNRWGSRVEDQIRKRLEGRGLLS